MRIFAAVVAIALAMPAVGAAQVAPPAEPWSGTWGQDPENTSASLARGGWRFLAMSTMSWPDGSQAVVTMWVSELGDFARCFDYFDPELRQTGGRCERSGTGL
jgi:hypothetical protein